MMILNMKRRTKREKNRPRKNQEMIEDPIPLVATKKEAENVEEKPTYHAQCYKMKEGEILINRTPTSEALKGKQFVGWTIEDDEMVKEVNLRMEEDWMMVKT